MCFQIESRAGCFCSEGIPVIDRIGLGKHHFVCNKVQIPLWPHSLHLFICLLGSKCSGFHSCFTCACGQPTYAHETVVETKQERLAQGKPVGQDVPYAAMGGLTGFSSLAEGYMRLDDSGIGKCG